MADENYSMPVQNGSSPLKFIAGGIVLIILIAGAFVLLNNKAATGGNNNGGVSTTAASSTASSSTTTPSSSSVPSSTTTPVSSTTTPSSSGQLGPTQTYINQQQASRIVPPPTNQNSSSSYNVTVYNSTSPTNVSTFLSGGYISSNASVNQAFAQNITSAWLATYVAQGSYNGTTNASVMIDTIYKSANPKSTYAALFSLGLPPEFSNYNVTNQSINGLTYSYVSARDKFAGNAQRAYLVTFRGNYVSTVDIIGSNLNASAAAVAAIVANDTR